MTIETPDRPLRRWPPRKERQPGSYREPVLLAERGLRELVTGWCLVGIALAGDLAAFFIVLAVLFEAAPIFILAVSLGFAVGAILVTHAIGKELAERRCAEPKANTVLLAGAVGAWLLLGLTAFIARYRFGPERTGDVGSVFPSGVADTTPATGGSGQALAAAGLFAALYLASGLGAIYVSYRWFNPLADAYRRASRHLRRAVTAETTSRAALVRAQHVLDQHEREYERETDRWRAAREQALALMLELQNYARNLMASGTQDPSSTDGLTGTGPYPLLGGSQPSSGGSQPSIGGSHSSPVTSAAAHREVARDLPENELGDGRPQ
ncbi:MAG: hypothetical protein M3308_04430 [Actinomycetota bacterium]|nr:hypothetical protein [Actinomycetota bacterium]